MLQLSCCWTTTKSPFESTFKRLCVEHQPGELLHTKLYPSANVIPEYCFQPPLSLHGMVWIVTLRSQCNYWANTQACTAGWSQQRLCFCLSKQTLSIFDVRFVWVSNNKTPKGATAVVGHRTKSPLSTQIIYKMNKTRHTSTQIWRGLCRTKRWWWISWPHIPKRHLLYIYEEVILFTEVQSNWLSLAWC